MKKKILVLGGAGLLGSSIIKHLSYYDNFLISGSFNSKMPAIMPDIKCFRLDCLSIKNDEILEIFSNYDFVVNCIMFSKNLSEIDTNYYESMLFINSIFPNKIVSITENKLRTKIIHISSDAIFSGNKSIGYYTEDSVPDPKDYYGATKALGESRGSNVLNVRASFIGNDFVYNRGLLEWVLSSQKGVNLNGFKDYIWSGVTTLQFSSFIAYLASFDNFSKIRNKSHVVNYTCNAPISKYDLIKMIVKTAGRDDIQVSRVSSPSGLVNRSLKSMLSQIDEFNVNQSSLEKSLQELMSERNHD